MTNPPTLLTPPEIPWGDRRNQTITRNPHDTYQFSYGDDEQLAEVLITVGNWLKTVGHLVGVQSIFTAPGIEGGANQLIVMFHYWPGITTPQMPWIWFDNTKDQWINIWHLPEVQRFLPGIHGLVRGVYHGVLDVIGDGALREVDDGADEGAGESENR